MDVFRHDPPGPKMESVQSSGFSEGIYEPLSSSIFREKLQSAVARESQEVRFTIIVVLHFFSRRQCWLVRHLT